MTRAVKIPKPIIWLLGAIVLGVFLFAPGAPVADGQSGNSLLVQIAPEILPPDQDVHEVVYVQLRAPDGTPAIADRNQTIRLFSSNPGIAEPVGGLTIREGASFGIGSIQLFDSEGQLTVTATGKGLVSGSATLTVEATSEVNGNLWIELDPAPLWNVENGDSPALLGVTVVDDEGTPVVLASDQAVLISSSNPDVASAQNEVVIPAGRSSINVPIDIGVAGKADFIGIASGFSSSPRELHVRPQTGVAAELVVNVVPEQLTPGREEQNPVAIVSAKDEEGQPTAIPCQPIFISSSDPSVAATAWSVERDCSSMVTTLEIPLQLEGEVGSITVVAASDGLRSGAGKFSAVATSKSRLRTTVVPSDVLYGDLESPVLVIEARNELDRPFNLHNGFDVLLSSANDPIAETLRIQPGKSYGIWPLDGLDNQDNEKNDWWISAPGFESANTVWDVDLLPLEIRIEIHSDPLLPGEQVSAVAYVTSSGVPIPGAAVSWHPTGLNILGSDQTTDYSGRAIGSFTVESAGDHRIQVSAKSPAYYDVTDAVTVNSVSRSELSVAPARLLRLPPTYWLLLIAGLLLASIGLARMNSQKLPRILAVLGGVHPVDQAEQDPGTKGKPDLSEANDSLPTLPIERFHQTEPLEADRVIEIEELPSSNSNETTQPSINVDKIQSIKEIEGASNADRDIAKNIAEIEASLTALVNQNQSRVHDVAVAENNTTEFGTDDELLQSEVLNEVDEPEISIEEEQPAEDSLDQTPEEATVLADDAQTVEQPEDDQINLSDGRVERVRNQLDSAVANFRALENTAKNKISIQDFEGATIAVQQVAEAQRAIAQLSAMIGEQSPIDETRVWMRFAEIQLKTGKFPQMLRSLEKAERSALQSKKLRIWSGAIIAMRRIPEYDAA